MVGVVLADGGGIFLNREGAYPIGDRLLKFVPLERLEDGGAVAFKGIAAQRVELGDDVDRAVRLDDGGFALGGLEDAGIGLGGGRLLKEDDRGVGRLGGGFVRGVGEIFRFDCFKVLAVVDAVGKRLGVLLDLVQIERIAPGIGQGEGDINAFGIVFLEVIGQFGFSPPSP